MVFTRHWSSTGLKLLQRTPGHPGYSTALFSPFFGHAAVALPSSDISTETDKSQPDCPPKKVDQVRESLWDPKRETGTETTLQEIDPKN